MTKKQLFTEEEYKDWEARPDLNEAWDRLPVVRKIAGFKIRWLGPLVELGYDDWLGDVSTTADGYFGWDRLLPEGQMLDSRGRIRADWSRAFKSAVEKLVWQAELDGGALLFEPDRWASWLCHTLYEPNKLIRAEAERRGWDR